MEFRDGGLYMKRILVIEDDEMLNAGLCYNLQMEGFEAAPAFGAKTAKKLWKEKSFDLILLDGNLPDGDGFAVSRENSKKKVKVPNCVSDSAGYG